MPYIDNQHTVKLIDIFHRRILDEVKDLGHKNIIVRLDYFTVGENRYLVTLGLDNNINITNLTRNEIPLTIPNIADKIFNDSKIKEIYFIQKNILDKYKDLCHYKDLIEFFKNNKNILNGIVLSKLNENYIKNIINQIPHPIIYKIENINEKNLLKELKKEDDNNPWNYKYFIKDKNNKRNKNIKYIDDFGLIDEKSISFFQKNNFKVVKGNYFAEREGIFIFIPHESIFEIGRFDQFGNFSLHYILGQNEISDFNYFIKALTNAGIGSIFNKIKEGKSKTDIKYNIFINKCRSTFSFYIINDIINGNIKNNIINTEDNNINNITELEATNINNNHLIETSNIYNDINESIFEKSNDLVMRDSNNKKYEFIDKLKCLILLSIYQKIINKNNGNIQKVFLLNKKYLNQFYFNEIDELVNNNKKIKKIIDNKNVKDLSLKLIETNIFNDNQFAKVINKLPSNKNVHIPYIYEGENFSLSDIKNIKIFESFIIINEELSKDMEDQFLIKFGEPYISYISINGKDFLIINDNQYTIFFGNLNYEDHKYNIDYILNFENQKNLIEEFEVVINKGHINYINDNLIFDKYGKKEDIFPIFSKNDILEIIGYGYKYKNSVYYANVIDYTKYLNNESLTNNISLFIHYENLKNKKSKNFEKYYLINSEYINNIKIDNHYKLLKDILDENIKKVKIFDNNKKNIYSLLKTLPKEFLSNYFSDKSNDNQNKSQFNTTVEPLMITINYFDHINQSKNDLYIYNNFEIIEKKMIKSFIDNYENTSILCECFFEKEKIIINMPYNLNNKSISLVGILDKYYYYFTLEYILIYNSENDRINHLNINLNKLDNYLNNLQFYKNNAPITIGNNFYIIGTVIKYKKDNDTDDNQDDENDDFLKFNFKSCPNIGLQNIGATCYMNSTLQCFCHIKKFVEFFKYTKIIKNKKDKKDKLSSSFKILIDNLWPNNFDPSSPKFKKYYSPEEFKNKISKMNPLFEGIAANDAKDLVNFIIMTLHLELNKTIKLNENQINGIIDQTNKELIKQIFKEDFDKKNNSIISELFYAINYNTTQCFNCQKCIYNFQTYFFINFPLEEVRKYKIEIINNQQNQYNYLMMNPFNNYNMLQQNQFMMNQQIQMNNNINEVYILECFDYDEKTNYMSGDNQMYCNNCKQNCDSYMKTNLYTGPEVLILILNRGKGIEFNVKIYFTEELDLSKYIENKETGYMYKLIGVITHLGESSMSGHFIAYCKDPINGKWYKYNDAIVDEVKDFKKEVIDFAMPYLLFYQKDNK